jgi:nickel-dependent lactate racemase
MIDHPLARAGILLGNPVHEDIVEQAKMANLNFIVNVLLNEKQEITHVFAGDPLKAHQKGCEMEKNIAGFKVNHKADITITTNGGMPMDLDLYQTCKGIDNAALITREGGIIIIASSCSAGAGPEAFRKLHSSALSLEDVLQKIKDAGPDAVQWQNQLLARTQVNNDVYLVSELDAGTVKEMKMVPVRSIEEGLEKAFRALGSQSEVMLIPEGPQVLPVLEE